MLAVSNELGIVLIICQEGHRNCTTLLYKSILPQNAHANLGTAEIDLAYAMAIFADLMMNGTGMWTRLRLFHVVSKASQTKEREGTQGLGVVLAETKTAAKSVIEAFYGLNANILVQEFIKEAGGSDIRVIVVGGKVIAAYKRQGQEGEFRSNLHRGGEGVKVNYLQKRRKPLLQPLKHWV